MGLRLEWSTLCHDPIICSLMDDSPEAAMERIRKRGGFDRAEVCLNGHVSHAMLDNYQNRSRPYCSQCGVKTIQACPSCTNVIRGPRLGGTGSTYAKQLAQYHVPAFCDYCGSPYPWTAARIHAAQALAEEIEGLTDSERIMLKASIEDIASESAMADVGVVRFKKLLPKMANEAGGALRRLVVDVAGKAAAEALKGNG